MMLRKISFVAAVAAVLAMPAVAMARGGGGGGGGGMHMGGGGGMHMGGGGMHMGGGGGRWGGGGMHAMHMGGPSFGGVGRVQSFRSAGVFPGRHAFFAGQHFRHFHHGRFFVGGLGFYGYGYGSCYRPVLTPWGWRYTWVCGDYGDYDY